MSLLEKITDPLFDQKELDVYVLRLDKLHPVTGGNKYFKLNYNLLAAKKLDHEAVLSFGGAYSNHIAALAAAAKKAGLRSIGVIRGDELDENSNPTLKRAAADGMGFFFVDRMRYTVKDTPGFLQELRERFGDVFIIPEGGSNAHAVKGCMEIKERVTIPFDYMLAACGTGGTIAGIALSLEAQQQAIGIPVLKGAQFLEADIAALQNDYFRQYNSTPALRSVQLVHDYHFGGYAKSTEELLQFKKDFEQEAGIPLDRIYTAKAFFALYDLARKNYFPRGKTIIIVHTGGLQGSDPLSPKKKRPGSFRAF